MPTKPSLSIFAAAALSLALASAPTHATLSGALDGMMFATTQPGAYASQSRRGFIGGSFGVRTPIKNVNLVNVAVPDVKAGCGGIDIFGGAFSFISAEEFKQLIRAIGQNAAGYALYMAIETMCPTCLNILNTLRDAVTKLNSMKLNSCEIAKGAITSLRHPEKLKEVATDVASTVSTVIGSFSDWLETESETTKDPDKPTQEAGDHNDYYGNVVWRAFFKSRAPNKVGATGSIGSTLDRDVAMAIMSMTGTVVYPTGNEESETPCAYDPNDAAACEGKVAIFAPILHHTDLREGSSDRNKRMYSCLDGYTTELDCRQLSTQEYTFIGTKGWVLNQIFGHPNPESQGFSSSSIIGRVISGQPLTSAQQNFVNSVSVPFYSMMLHVQNAPSAVALIGMQAAEIIEPAITFELLSSIYTILGEAFGEGDSLPPPEDYLDSQDRISAALTELASEMKDQHKLIVELREFAEVTSRGIPAPKFKVAAMRN
jgi:conjugative transfer pilus assembly protein TraH